MKDKYWALVLIGIILLACTGGFLSYKHGFGDGYKGKTCPVCVCPDNYDKGYEDCKKIYEERIDYCFEKCQYDIMIVGGSDLHRTCLWNCFHPDPNEICTGPITWCGPDKIGRWKIVNGQCHWDCQNS